MGATISVSSIYGLDIRELDFSSIYYASDYTTAGNIFRASYGGGDADEFRGSGFRYNSYGEPTAGTVSSYAAFRGGNKMFSVDGVTIAATSIVKVANTNSTTDDLSLIASALKGNDIFKGGGGADFVKLYGGNDILVGNGGNDTLNGGAGNDKITGGRGHDYLYGEAGSDIFIYNSIVESTYASSGRDTIYDFTSTDRLDLSGIDANTKTAKNDAFIFISSKAFTGKAGELRFDKMTSDTYVYGDTNGDGKADFAIHLDDPVALQKGYFVL
jgi:Ca2+-binding RTX toxin-like protein